MTTRSGTCTPRPVIETGAPFAAPITAAAVANVRVPRTASSSPTRATALPRPTGPRTASSSQVSVSSSPGSTIRLKRTSSIPAKSASLPRFSSSDSAAIAPAWASASTMITPGMIGRPGKCPGKNHSSPRDELAGDDAHTRLELEHLVEEEEGIAVRDDRLDHVATERRLRRHVPSESSGTVSA